MNQERYETLMVTVVDGTASPADREELMRHLVDHPDKRRELESHQALRALTDGWVARLEYDLALDAHTQSPLTTTESWLGLALLLAATGALLGGAGWEIWLDPETPGWLKLALSLGTGGSLVLLASAVRWRWQTAKSDPYKEIVR